MWNKARETFIVKIIKELKLIQIIKQTKMSNQNNQVRNLSESVRLDNVGIDYYMNKKYEMLNYGYVNINKRSENTRILALNLRGLNP